MTHSVPRTTGSVTSVDCTKCTATCTLSHRSWAGESSAYQQNGNGD